jgi:hypothetical protein
VLPLPHCWLALLNDDRLSFSEERKAEGTAGLPLAFGAMACVDGKRSGRDFICHGPALASAGQRQFEVRFHGKCSEDVGQGNHINGMDTRCGPKGTFEAQMLF